MQVPWRHHGTTVGFICIAFVVICIEFDALLKVHNKYDIQNGGIPEINHFNSDAPERKTGIWWTDGADDANPPVRKWAYVFLAGGCSSKIPEHIGFVAHIAASAHNLLRHGSKAEVVALIQMSHDAPEDTLPEDEARLLEVLPTVKVKYIPKVSSAVHQNFYVLMMEKFRVLDLTEYSRVIFLDGDVFPKKSLDYLFELSEPDPESEEQRPSLSENLIMTGHIDPAQGGFFMLKPCHKDYLRAQEIIRKTEKAALDQPWPHWDPVVGFGHIIDPSDQWGVAVPQSVELDGKKRTDWTWHGSFADQGFLYHWVRYEKENVSIITNDQLDTYTSLADGGVHKRTTFNKNANGVLNRHSKLWRKENPAPMSDFQHFVGRGKPWYINRTDTTGLSGVIKDWFENLEAVEKMANVTMKFPAGRGTPLGKFPLFKYRIEHIRLHAKNNWNMYV